jgi:hypothetical protein
MEKEIDLNLPAYESKMVVEAYLIPGETFKLSIFESVSYFDSPELPTVDSAIVIISYNGIIDTLKFDPHIHPVTGRFYNYHSPSIIPFDYTSDFFLEIKDKKGRKATSKTTIPFPVTIDTITFKYNNDSLAYPLTTFFDNTTTTNYYRYQVQKLMIGQEITDFQFDDRLITSSEIALGSTYSLKKDEVIVVSLYHITKEYFDFLESVSYAIDANGNPFGQPAVIKSNIEGAIGIFTGIGLDQRQLIVP